MIVDMIMISQMKSLMSSKKQREKQRKVWNELQYIENRRKDKMKNPFGAVRKCLQAHTGLFAIRDEEGHRIAEDLTEINANFLVAAINNHENLVEACKWAYEAVCTGDEGASEKAIILMDKISVDLATAKGEK